MKVFIVDISKCNGCYNCQLVCKDEHVGNDWSPYAKPQPDIGHFWMKIQEKTHGQIPKVKVEYTPTPCMHCDNAPCISAAKENAVYKREDGLVIIDPAKAHGQRNLLEACPYNAIYWNEDLQLPQKCTGCAHLVDQGREPRCVEACPTGALQFGDEDTFSDLIAAAEVIRPEDGSNSRVYYLNCLRYFIAGEVFDPIEDECVKDAQVTLTCAATGQTSITTTDHFGDFWFKKLSPGLYHLSVWKEGFKTYEITAVNVTDSINLKEIALEKE